MKFACDLCGYIYDESVGDVRNGILPGTAFELIASDYECPGCGCEKEAFDPVRPKEILQTHSHTRMLRRR